MQLIVKEITDNGDGTSTLVFDYDDEFLEYMREILKTEEPTEDQITEYVVQLIEKEAQKSEEEQESE